MRFRDGVDASVCRGRDGLGVGGAARAGAKGYEAEISVVGILRRKGVWRGLVDEGELWFFHVVVGTE